MQNVNGVMHENINWMISIYTVCFDKKSFLNSFSVPFISSCLHEWTSQYPSCQLNPDSRTEPHKRQHPKFIKYIHTSIIGKPEQGETAEI